MNGKNHSQTIVPGKAPEHCKLMLFSLKYVEVLHQAIQGNYTFLPVVELHLASEVPYAKAFDRIVCDC